MSIIKVLDAWVVLQNNVAPLNTFIIPPIIGIWCLIIPILGPTKHKELRFYKPNPHPITPLVEE